MELVIGGIYRHYSNKEYRILDIGSFDDDIKGVYLYDAVYSEDHTRAAQIFRMVDGKIKLRMGDGSPLEVDYDGDYVIYQALYDDPQFGKKTRWFRPLSGEEGFTTPKNSVERFAFVSK